MAVNVGTLEALLKLRDEMSPALKTANQNVSLFSGALGKLAAMAGGVLSVGAAISAVNKAMMAQAESEAAINKLNLALANQGMYTEKASKALQAHAAALQNVSTFDDEAIIRAEALLASFRMNEDQIKRTTVAAANLAAGMGIDLEAAVSLLGRAFAGNTQMLSRYGIVVDENIPKAQKFEAVMQQLETRFGGQAQAATQTYAGSMKQLGNAVGDVWETVGKFFGFLTSSGDKPFQGLINAAKALQKFFGQDLIIAFSELKARIAEALAFIAGASEKVFDVLGKLPGAIGAGFRKSAEDVGLLRAGLEDAAEKFRAQGDAAAASAGKIQEVTNNTAPLVTGTRQLTEEQEKAVETLKKWTQALEDAEQKATESAMTSEAALIQSWFNEEEAFYQHTANMMTQEEALIAAWKRGEEDIIAGYMNQADAAIQSGMTQIEVARQTLAELTSNYNALLATGRATDDQLLKAYTAMKVAEKKVDDESLKVKLLQFNTVAEAASGILRSLFGKSKAAAIAAAIIDTIAAVVKTFAQFGWPWGIIPAAAAAAAGYAEVQKIRNTEIEGFAQGSQGFMDFGRETPANLHGIERVQTPAQAEMEIRKAGGGAEVADEIRGLRQDLSDLPQIIARSFRDAQAFRS